MTYGHISKPQINLKCAVRVGLIFVIDIRELLAVVVAHDKTGVQFLDGPRWREVAHSVVI